MGDLAIWRLGSDVGSCDVLPTVGEMGCTGADRKSHKPSWHYWIGELEMVLGS